MNYLLIDSDKCQFQLQAIAHQQSEQLIYIFSKRRKKLHKIAHIQKNNTHIHTINCKNKKVYSCIIDKLKIILQQNHTAHILIFSKRKKLKKAIFALSEVYSHANMVLLKKFSKKYINKIKQESISIKYLPDNPQDSLLPQSEFIPPSLFQATIQLLKKTRPKKKIDLLKILMNHLHLQESVAQQLLTQLKDKHFISIDIAENIKYF